ncbi:MAG: TrkA C-terminal domain-containing protein [Halobacteriaceae archaeon]
MAQMPIQIVRGLYLGILTGIIPALIAWTLAFLFRHITGLTVPSFAIVVLGVAIAGINGGFLALNDPQIIQSANSITLITAILVVMMATFYAHAKGDQLGASLPRFFTWSNLREQTLSSDVIEFVGKRGQVTVTVIGEVQDIEGYPPVSETLRSEIQAIEWTFPADLGIETLEQRVADRLQSEFDVMEASVDIDSKARATVKVAAPLSGLSKRVHTGQRAVSVEGLVPTGLARGEKAELVYPDTTISGTVVSARSGNKSTPPEKEAPPTETEAEPIPPKAPTTTGGEGRVTIAVDREYVEKVLQEQYTQLLIKARGIRQEFAFISLLRRTGKRIKRLTVQPDSQVTGRSLESLNLRERYQVVLIGVRDEGTWNIAPNRKTVLQPNNEIFVIGQADALKTFEEEML